MRLEQGEAAPLPRVPERDHRIDRLYAVESSWRGSRIGTLRLGALTTAIARGFPVGDHLPLGDIRPWLQPAATGKDDPADGG